MDFKYLILKIRDLLRKIPPVFWIYRNFILIEQRIYLSRPFLSFIRKIVGNEHKPVLYYLEFHVVSHCNLRCKGCSQFSPLFKPWYADLKSHEYDMKRLSGLFSKIKIIRLIGGEPLLHPDIEDFIKITRKYFQKSRICIATNGTNLSVMPDSFWETCRINRIKINWSIYPPLQNNYKMLVREIKERGIMIAHRKIYQFRAILNPAGDSDSQMAMKFCRSLYFCPFLNEGKIYICSRPLVIKTFNNTFGTKIPDGTGFEIHNDGTSGWDALLYLAKDSETCKYCATNLKFFKWEDSGYEQREWSV